MKFFLITLIFLIPKFSLASVDCIGWKKIVAESTSLLKDMGSSILKSHVGMKAIIPKKESDLHSISKFEIESHEFYQKRFLMLEKHLNYFKKLPSVCNSRPHCGKGIENFRDWQSKYIAVARGLSDLLRQYAQEMDQVTLDRDKLVATLLEHNGRFAKIDQFNKIADIAVTPGTDVCFEEASKVSLTAIKSYQSLINEIAH